MSSVKFYELWDSVISRLKLIVSLSLPLTVLPHAGVRNPVHNLTSLPGQAQDVIVLTRPSPSAAWSVAGVVRNADNMSNVTGVLGSADADAEVLFVVVTRNKTQSPSGSHDGSDVIDREVVLADPSQANNPCKF